MALWVNRLADIKQRILGWCRLSHVILGSQLTILQGRYRYIPRQPILAGWYMLSVSGQRALLGKPVSFLDSLGGVFNIFMTTKPIIKRIVKIESNSDWLDIISAPDDAGGECLLNVSLVRLSTRFAVSRMRRKLAFASTYQVLTDDLSNEELYQLYTQRVDKQNSEVSYEDWYLKHQLLNATKASAAQRNGNRLLTVVQQPEINTAATSTSVISHDNLLVNQSGSDSWASTADTDFICLLGSDVIPNKYLVPLVEQAIVDNPDIWLFYTDHDVQHADGQRLQPCFKPGWNPEMLLSGNYLGQALIVSRGLLEQVGAPDANLGASALYGWLLRALPLLDDSRVFRIPLVLYSYPDSRQNTAAYLSTGEQDEQVLAEFLLESGYSAVAQSGLIEGTHTVQWQLPSVPSSVDIIIPSKDKVELLSNCINSVLEKTLYTNFHITVVDNGSTEDQTLDYYNSISADERVTVLNFAGDFNYSALNNFAVSQTQGDILLLLNNDTEVINAEWLENMVAQASREEVGCVGAKLHYASGQIQHAGVILGMFGMAGHAHRLSEFDDDGYCGRLKIAHNVSAVTGACMAVRRSVYNEIGQLDDVNLRVAYNDVDLCLRAREAGYQNIWTPHASLYHYESISRGSEDTHRKRKRFQQEFSYMQQRWGIKSYVDMAYNPNLALDSEDFSLAA